MMYSHTKNVEMIACKDDAVNSMLSAYAAAAHAAATAAAADTLTLLLLSLSSLQDLCSLLP
jgi:hypothetical protein